MPAIKYTDAQFLEEFLRSDSATARMLADNYALDRQKMLTHTPPRATVRWECRELHGRIADRIADELARQLPPRVALKVFRIALNYCEDPAFAPTIDIIWRGTKAALNLDIGEGFPTDADIARICLECP